MTEEPKKAKRSKSISKDKKRERKGSAKSRESDKTVDEKPSIPTNEPEALTKTKTKRGASTDHDTAPATNDAVTPDSSAKKKKRKRDTKDHPDAVDRQEDAKTDATKKEPANEAEAGKDTEEVDDRRDSKKRQRLLEREALLAKVPKVDPETGFSYTKQQIRRMRKRVARGLDPVETPAEKHARLVLDAQLRKEEEAELAGLIVAKPNKNGAASLDDEDEDNDEDDPMDDIDQENDNEEDVVDDPTEAEASTAAEDAFSYEKAPKSASVTLAEKPKKKQRDKPVPDDYVCSACQNTTGTTRHWIYDCPQKKRMPGTNQVSRKQRGLNNPADNKVFVSGLPFDTTPADVMALFASPDENGASKKQVVQCKLIKFEDTGRCKGQAFVTFDSAEAAKRALKLNGTVIDNAADDKKGQKSVPKTRKELKLKVTKVLNRVVTKAKK